MSETFSIKKLDKGFIVTKDEGSFGLIKEAHNENQIDEILQKVAFFLTGKVGVIVSIHNLEK